MNYSITEILQGSKGSGKTFVAVARAVQHLQSGGVVATNFPLNDGWAEMIARQNIFCRLSKDLFYKKAQSLYDRHFMVNSLNAIRAINPKQLAVGIHQANGKYKEGQGLLIIDECQDVFNCRRWEKNSDWIHFCSQARKRGWSIIFIAHSIEMIDSQLRHYCEYESRFRNLQKMHYPFTCLPIVPFPVFLIVTRYAGLGPGSGVIHKKGLCPLPQWAANLYDSQYEFEKDSWGRDPDPMRCGPRPQDPESIRKTYFQEAFKDIHQFCEAGTI